MTEGPELVFEALASEHDRSGFSCGAPALDTYLRQHASKDVRRRTARVFVARAPEHVLAGYYSLGATSFARQSLPETLAKRLPRYPVPAALIGRLAVDRRYQRQGVGSLLLADAIKRVFRASGALAVYAIVVDAKDEHAKAFYEAQGFIAFADAPMRLYLPLETVLNERRRL